MAFLDVYYHIPAVWGLQFISIVTLVNRSTLIISTFQPEAVHID